MPIIVFIYYDHRIFAKHTKRYSGREQQRKSWKNVKYQKCWIEKIFKFLLFAVTWYHLDAADTQRELDIFGFYVRKQTSTRNLLTFFFFFVRVKFIVICSDAIKKRHSLFLCTAWCSMWSIQLQNMFDYRDRDFCHNVRRFLLALRVFVRDSAVTYAYVVHTNETVYKTIIYIHLHDKTCGNDWPLIISLLPKLQRNTKKMYLFRVRSRHKKKTGPIRMCGIHAIIRSESL